MQAQLASVPDGMLLWSQSSSHAVGDLLALQDQLSQCIAQSLAVPLMPRERVRLRRDVPATARAYELYLRGKYAGSDADAEANFSRAVDAFDTALSLDAELPIVQNLYAQLEVEMGRPVDAVVLIMLDRRDEALDLVRQYEPALHRAARTRGFAPALGRSCFCGRGW